MPNADVYGMGPGLLDHQHCSGKIVTFVPKPQPVSGGITGEQRGFSLPRCSPPVLPQTVILLLVHLSQSVVALQGNKRDHPSQSSIQFPSPNSDVKKSIVLHKVVILSKLITWKYFPFLWKKKKKFNPLPFPVLILVCQSPPWNFYAGAVAVASCIL